MPRSIFELSPDQAASHLLTEANGVQRHAETAAWTLQKSFKPDDYEFRFVRMIVQAILSGTETPKVERKDAPTHELA